MPTLVRRLLVLSTPVCAAVLAYGGWTLWRASKSVEEAERKVTAALPVRVTRISRQSTSAEPVGATANFRDAVAWRGLLYLCGPAGLFAYQPDGTLRASYLVGVDLPAAPLVALRVGIGAGGSDQELWIATKGEGALAFDGKSFRQVLPSESSQRSLTSILPLSTGRVLLGTERAGVLVFDGTKLERFHSSLDGVHVTALEGGDNDIWIGTLDRGVMHGHGGQLDAIGELPDKHVLSIAAGGSRAWVGTALGVAEIDNGRVRRVIGQGVFAGAVHQSKGKLSIGTIEGDILEVATESEHARPASIGVEPTGAGIQRLLEIDGQMLALTAHQLLTTKGGRTVVQAPEGALADRNISALSVDGTGRVWVGYFDRGLDVLSADLAKSRHFENDRVFCVNRVAHDLERGITAVATANGLVLFDAEPRQKQVLTRNDGIIANHVTDVAMTTGGGMALATAAGVSLVDVTGVRSLYAFHGLVNNHAYALGASSDRLYVGTLGGLSLLESGLVRANYTTANSPLKHNWISAVAAADDEWYVGTYGAGIVRIAANGAWSSYADFPAKLEINPNALAVSASHVYAGSLDGGLWVLDRSTQRWSARTAGLPSRNVTAVAASGGVVYIGTDNGLVKFKEDQL